MIRRNTNPNQASRAKLRERLGVITTNTGVLIKRDKHLRSKQDWNVDLIALSYCGLNYQAQTGSVALANAAQNYLPQSGSTYVMVAVKCYFLRHLFGVFEKLDYDEETMHLLNLLKLCHEQVRARWCKRTTAAFVRVARSLGPRLVTIT